MKKRNLLTLIGAFVGLSAFGQNYIETNVNANRVVLGQEPEELLEDGTATTPQGNIDYNTAFYNTIHANFSNDYPHTAALTKVGDNASQFSPEELNAMGANNMYGIQVDTLDNKIMDMDGDLITSFTDINDFYTKMDQLVDDIVETDIDVLPVGVEEMNKRIAEYLSGPVNKVFPNPTRGLVNIDLKDGVDGIKMDIYNLSGQYFGSQVLNHDSQINLDELAKGIYVLKFNYKNKNQNIKVVTQ